MTVNSPPDELYEELFADVQLARIFPDSKTFPDCIPLRSPSDILASYRQIRDTPEFNLKTFVKNNFNEPESFNLVLDNDGQSWTIVEHCQALWSYLTRNAHLMTNDPSLLPVPNDFVVPGGRFREFYYWDSYFIMLGLKESDYVNLISNMVSNFAYLMRTHGHIPNGNRNYYLGRSQPPFFSFMVELLDSLLTDQNILVDYLPELEIEYEFWMDGSADLTSSSQSHRRVVRMTDGTLLNRFYDDIPKPRPEAFYEDYHTAHSSTSERNESDIYVNIRAAAESGWDFSSRWLVNAGDLSTIYTTDIIPVDLNCLMFNLERVLASAYEKKFDRSMSQHYRQLAQKRKTAIQTYFWSKEHDYFMDYDFRLNQPTKSMTLAGVYPLWTELATEEQASAVMDKIERLFLKDGGLVTTINEKSHQQWDFPNGWAPLQYITYKGILNYSPRSPLVKKIIDQWMMLNEKVFNETRKMVEKYDVVNTNAEAGGGEYKTQDGFGWTNGVYLEMLKDRKNLMRKSHF